MDAESAVDYFTRVGRTLMRLVRQLTDYLVNLAPRLVVSSLRRNHYELVAREFNAPGIFSWSLVQLPTVINRFEDLLSLFELSPLNRGIIRQDFDEAAALFHAVRNLGHAHGVEIGRFSGGSTVLLAAAVGDGGSLISIDTTPQSDKVLSQVLARTNLAPRVELIVADANHIDRPGPYDFVFIDGDHSYEGAKRDHNKWGKLVKIGGLIIHHDMANNRRFATQWPELAPLRADILDRQRSALELVQETGSLAVFRRRDNSWIEI
jgi:predicted O-methyltransferase YrrM